ncbi:MAG: hypothetical protein LBS23_00040, partial [Holosporaceae bacterium]|nr:hypothetical protein [Holosporaceae bacterium]
MKGNNHEKNIIKFVSIAMAAFISNGIVFGMEGTSGSQSQENTIIKCVDDAQSKLDEGSALLDAIKERIEKLLKAYEVAKKVSDMQRTENEQLKKDLAQHKQRA